MDLGKLSEVFKNCKEQSAYGRYIDPKVIADIVHKLPSTFEVKIAGISVQKRDVFSVQFGTGKTKILMWSQMHGNESTTTKAVLDFLNVLQQENTEENLNKILKECTFLIFPMLNPDGSFLWTRNNANDVDLNRDAKDLSQPESKILRAAFDEFQPDFCFNLHGQRTIYGFEDTGEPSVLSFLAPSADEDRGFSLSRKRSTYIITHIYKSLQTELAGRIGLYDDGFNNNCVGDAFQELEVPTILFEAGHYPDDYAREETRRYIFASLLFAIEAAVTNVAYEVANYLEIPLHSKCFCDVHQERGDGVHQLYYTEVKDGNAITFYPEALPEAYGNGTFSHKKVKDLTVFKI